MFGYILALAFCFPLREEYLRNFVRYATVWMLKDDYNSNVYIYLYICISELKYLEILLSITKIHRTFLK